jgi:hypothetical protein
LIDLQLLSRDNSAKWTTPAAKSDPWAAVTASKEGVTVHVLALYASEIDVTRGNLQLLCPCKGKLTWELSPTMSPEGLDGNSAGNHAVLAAEHVSW